MKKYPKILSLGHDLVAEIFDNPVELSEKIDGSQCRIHLTTSHCDCGSKNTGHADEKMFELAHKQTERIWNERIWCTFGNDVTLFCEFLNKPKHNVLVYDRVPLNNLYLFGGIIDDEHLRTEDLMEVAKELNIEPPNILGHEVEIKSEEDIKGHLTTESVLGGTKLEGVVIKNYHLSYPPLLVSTQAFLRYPLAGKLVRDDFKERLNKEWGGKKKKVVPLIRVVDEFLTEARFNKTIQHVTDEGNISNEMSDLKYLIPEFYNDLLDEEKEAIIEIAMVDFWKQLRKRCDGFVVNSYKTHLLDRQFDKIEKIDE